MIKLSNGGTYLINGEHLVADDLNCENKIRQLTGSSASKQHARKGTITYSILESHNTSDNMSDLELKFDSLASHDLTFVGIIQTAKASGLEKFPMPYVLTNCHNSLCAVGGTLNEDDHRFGLSAAKKYGGIFVPAHQSVIHSYMREMYAACGSMILGSDSHTRYGALGTMGIGEGGGELVKQLLEKTYSTPYPDVVCVYMKGKPQPGVGPHDIALAIIGAVFQNGYVKNKVMEFVGEGVGNLSADFRNGIDVMTTETACLSSIWRTDDVIWEYLACHGRVGDFHELNPDPIAYYDGLIEVNLSEIKPMIALPFHPANTYTIDYFNENLKDLLHQIELDAKELINPNIKLSLNEKIVNGKFRVEQGIIAGCAGGAYENIMDAAAIIGKRGLGNDEFALSVYPESQPVMIELSKHGVPSDLMNAGATVRTAFCGPCFGAGDVPANGQFSIRHTTRNFPNREGSKPTAGQMACVGLMDARSIAATAINGGFITSATELADIKYSSPTFFFDKTAYENRVYNGFKKAMPKEKLIYGPNITDWPKISPLTDNILLGMASVITDPVTTTDELIPSGDASTYRSNPEKMAEFTLSRKDPAYVGEAKRLQQFEKNRLAGNPQPDELTEIFKRIRESPEFNDINYETTGIGSVIYATKPGDGSAREQAASCQRVLGGCANIAKEYATKRYRSNLINWGMFPFTIDCEAEFNVGEYIFISGIRKVLESGIHNISALHIGSTTRQINLSIGNLSDEERQILLSGCLINHYNQ